MKRSTIFLIAFLIVPAAVVAQTGGLTRVQLYALQQQLKAECGLAHVTGRMDGPTRHAIAVCNKKYGTHGNGAELLSAMNIGFSTGDNSPGMGTIMSNRSNTPAMSSSSAGMSGNAMGMSNRAAAGTPARRRARGASRDSALSAATDSMMRASRDAHGHNQGRTKKSDTTFAPLADSMLRADRGGNPPVNPPKKKH